MTYTIKQEFINNHAVSLEHCTGGYYIITLCDCMGDYYRADKQTHNPDRKKALQTYNYYKRVARRG